jgi:ornithine cyclodeaminase
MKLIDADTVHRILDYRPLVEALRAGHRKGVDGVERLLMTQPARGGATDYFLALPAWQRGEALGIKLVTVFPDNASAASPPTIQSVYVLFDGRDGRPLAYIEGTPLTLRKTAADSALAADYLARRDAETLLMVGAGNQAPYQIMAHVAVRPSLRRVLIWNRTPERARHLAAQLKLDGIGVDAVDDLAAAVPAADVISCATMSTVPLVRGAWLKPGTHLDLVGGYTNDMREADDEAVRRARVFVDTRWFTVGHCGDISGPMASGALVESGIAADLFELCTGKHPGRRTDDEITLFKNAGGSHLDLMTARFLYECADPSR